MVVSRSPPPVRRSPRKDASAALDASFSSFSSHATQPRKIGKLPSARSSAASVVEPATPVHAAAPASSFPSLDQMAAASQERRSASRPTDRAAFSASFPAKSSNMVPSSLPRPVSRPQMLHSDDDEQDPAHRARGARSSLTNGAIQRARQMAGDETPIAVSQAKAARQAAGAARTGTSPLLADESGDSTAQLIPGRRDAAVDPVHADIQVDALAFLALTGQLRPSLHRKRPARRQHHRQTRLSTPRAPRRLPSLEPPIVETVKTSPSVRRMQPWAQPTTSTSILTANSTLSTERPARTRGGNLVLSRLSNSRTTRTKQSPQETPLRADPSWRAPVPLPPPVPHLPQHQLLSSPLHSSVASKQPPPPASVRMPAPASPVTNSPTFPHSPAVKQPRPRHPLASLSSPTRPLLPITASTLLLVRIGSRPWSSANSARSTPHYSASSTPPRTRSPQQRKSPRAGLQSAPVCRNSSHRPRAHTGCHHARVQDACRAPGAPSPVQDRGRRPRVEVARTASPSLPDRRRTPACQKRSHLSRGPLPCRRRRPQGPDGRAAHPPHARAQACRSASLHVRAALRDEARLKKKLAAKSAASLDLQAENEKLAELLEEARQSRANGAEAGGEAKSLRKELAEAQAEIEELRKRDDMMTETRKTWKSERKLLLAQIEELNAAPAPAAKSKLAAQAPQPKVSKLIAAAQELPPSSPVYAKKRDRQPMQGASELGPPSEDEVDRHVVATAATRKPKGAKSSSPLVPFAKISATSSTKAALAKKSAKPAKAATNGKSSSSKSWRDEVAITDSSEEDSDDNRQRRRGRGARDDTDSEQDSEDERAKAKASRRKSSASAGKKSATGSSGTRSKPAAVRKNKPAMPIEYDDQTADPSATPIIRSNKRTVDDDSDDERADSSVLGAKFGRDRTNLALPKATSKPAKPSKLVAPAADEARSRRRSASCWVAAAPCSGARRLTTLASH